MPSTFTPENGDVLIRVESANGSSAFVISIVPGPPQVTASTREAARRHARSFAEKSGVRVWLQHAADFELVEDFRRRPLAPDTRASVDRRT